MDQTHQHHLNERLHLLNSQLEQINDEEYLGGFQYYPDNQKVTFDSVWVNMTLGYRVNDLRLRNDGLLTILSESDHSIFIQWLDSIQTHKTKNIKVHFIDALGKSRATLCGATKKTNAGIEIIYIWCKDISKNEDLENRVKELEFSDMQSDKMAFIGEMTNEITHELGNNIMSVSLILDLVKVKKEKNVLKIEDYDRMLTIVDKATNRMKSIITGVKHFSYTTDGAQFSNTPIEELIKEIQLFFKSILNAESFEFSIESDQVVSSHINCEPSYLIQGMMNLIKNAIDENISLDNPWVKVVILETESHFQFKVIDSGCGIPIELREKIFKQNFTTKEKGKGNGIGLSVANKAAKTHGGRFFLDTLADNTTFVIEIPI